MQYSMKSRLVAKSDLTGRFKEQMEEEEASAFSFYSLSGKQSRLEQAVQAILSQEPAMPLKNLG
jgi:hypothetical protein